MTQEKLDCPRDFPPPELSPDELMEIAGSLYGVSGALKRFGSERDEVVHIHGTDERDYVLRISGVGEPAQMLEFQNSVLRHIREQDPSLPVPECLPSRNGKFLEITRGSPSYGVRLMTYVPGVPTLGRKRSPAFRRDIGNHLARLNLAMTGLGTAPEHANLFWDVRKAASLGQFSQFISDGTGRQLVERTLDELVSSVLPQIAAFDQQVIHNDFNPKNVLADVDVPDRVSGIIDFGDMMSGPRIIDLSVAIARHLEIDNVAGCACAIVAGYNSKSKLTDGELSTLFTLICGRLAIRSAIWSWRYALGDKRASRDEIGSALRFLNMLYSIGAAEVTSMFLDLSKKST